MLAIDSIKPNYKGLPQPLTPEEYASLIKQLGGENNEAAKAALIERNLRFVASIAREFKDANANTEDLIAIGTIGLIKAINELRAKKRVNLSDYLSLWIKREINRYLKRLAGSTAGHVG